MSELQSKKSEMSGEIKQMYQKYENDIKTLQIQIEEEREKMGEIESQLKEKSAALEAKELKWNETEVSYKQMLQTLQEQQKQTE